MTLIGLWSTLTVPRIRAKKFEGMDNVARGYTVFTRICGAKHIERYLLKRTALAIALSLFSTITHARWDADLRNDEMTDERIGFAAERGSFGSSVAIQCQQEAEVIVIFMLPVDEKLRGRVTYRVDGETAETIPGFTLDGGVGVLGPDAKELIPKLLKGSELKVQGHQKGFSAQPTRVFTFGLTGSTAAFAKACSWHPGYHELTS